MLVGVATPQLALADDQPTLAQRWQNFTTAVQQTVSTWWNQLTGVQTLPSNPQRATASTPQQAPVPTPVTAAPAAALVQVAQPAEPTPAQQVKQVHDDFKSKSTFTVTDQGHAPASNLKKTKAGVPTFDFQKVKSVPLLNVGQEPRISKQNFSLPNWDWKIKELQQTKQLPSPALDGKNLSPMPVVKALPVKISPQDQSVIDGRVTKEKIDKIDYKIQDTSQIDLKPFEQMSPEFVKMLVTKILFDKGGHCPVVIGLADSLAPKAEFRSEATFEAGACAKELKLNQAAFDRLGELIRKQDAEFGKQALTILAKGLPVTYEPAFYELVKGLEGKEDYFSDKSARNEIFYRAAKGAFKLGHYKTAEQWASRVEGSTFGPSAQYLVGLSQYGNKDRAGAKATLEKLNQSLENSSDTMLKGLVQVDLARMDFTAHKFDQALQLYLKTPKDHPLWVQALIEQGWAQLALDDYAGAIGNMYSLHSPYFKVLYQPESFVVRTVGYLDICQYGDAYKTLTKLEQDYRDWNNRLSGYLNAKGAPSAYDLVKQYLRSKSNTDVQGVPFQLVREAARGKEFLNTQEAINANSDEFGLFSGIGDRIRKEKDQIRLRAEQAKHRAEALTAKLATLQSTHAPAGQIEDIKRNIEKERMRAVPNRFVLEIFEQSQQAFVQFQRSAQAKISESQHRLMSTANGLLTKRFQSMKSEMAKILDNNEFLRYEIFAGSGENIRYQVAGGQTSNENRLPASVKPQKMLNWAFDGEFWADEIGNYRSSLRNNCPKSGQASAQGN
jgi:TolA-binding protein